MLPLLLGLGGSALGASAAIAGLGALGAGAIGSGLGAYLETGDLGKGVQTTRDTATDAEIRARDSKDGA